jgi:hypothetical protein
LFKQLPTHQLSLPMTWYTTYHFQPDLNRGPHPSQGSALILFYHKPFPKPLQFACAHNSQKSKHILQRSLWPLMGGQKVKKIGWNFYGKCKDTICTCGKNFRFFLFKNKIMCHFKSNTCSISMANFQAWFRPWWWSHLDLSFIHKINLIKSSF